MDEMGDESQKRYKKLCYLCSL